MRQLRKTILIVCEGESTEPNYFKRLKDLLYDKYRSLERINDITITIDPIPKDEQIEFQLREGAKKRRTTALIVNEPEVEAEYRAQPLCYVRRAQIIGLQEGAYSDVWAVYDKDEHPRHQEAMELALRPINDSYVKVGFTSIAFEYWILLHFEKCLTPFQKSMCRGRDESDRVIGYFCGKQKYDEDCKGERCVCGKIVSSGYLDYIGRSKEFHFDAFHQYVNDAIFNALSVNKTYVNSSKEIFDENPYCNLYRLVFKLLHLPIDFLWFDSDVGFLGKNNIHYQIESYKGGLQVRISNKSDICYIHRSEQLVLVSVDGKQESIGKRIVIEPSGEEVVPLVCPDLSKFPFLGIREGEEIIHVTEIY